MAVKDKIKDPSAREPALRDNQKDIQPKDTLKENEQLKKKIDDLEKRASELERVNNSLENDIAELAKKNSELVKWSAELEKQIAAFDFSLFNYPQIIENAPIAFTRVLRDTQGYALANKEFSRQSGYTREEFNALPDNQILDTIHPDDKDAFLTAHAVWCDSGFKEVFRTTYRIINRDAKILWLDVYYYAELDDDGEPYAIDQIYVDITDMKKYETVIETSLKQKEALLREIHHRVKNNLQIISSLVKLQSSHLKSPEVKEIFAESQNRIKTMALIHEKLFYATDLSVIEFYDYVKNLMHNLFTTYSASTNRITPVISFRSVYLDIDTAIPCGLIINEVISNSLKYAFPDKKEGKIYINLTESEPGEYLLTIGDDGIGIPKEIDLNNATTMGLKLVKILSEQLSGKVHLVRQNGTEFRITFKKLNYLKRT
jgi:PAS domain S-box-containing protein